MFLLNNYVQIQDATPLLKAFFHIRSQSSVLSARLHGKRKTLPFARGREILTRRDWLPAHPRQNPDKSLSEKKRRKQSVGRDRKISRTPDSRQKDQAEDIHREKRVGGKKREEASGGLQNIFCTLDCNACNVNGLRMKAGGRSCTA